MKMHCLSSLENKKEKLRSFTVRRVVQIKIPEGDTEIYHPSTSEANDLPDVLMDVSQVANYLIPLHFWSTQRARRSSLPHLQHPV